MGEIETTVAVDEALRRHYRYPAGALNIRLTSQPRKEGFFRFGSATCFGACSVPGIPQIMTNAGMTLPEVAPAVTIESGSVHLPFDPGDIADNLRLERYVRAVGSERKKVLDASWIRHAYYLVRKFMPVRVRKHLQRLHLADHRQIPFPGWPVDCSADLVFEEVLRIALQACPGTAVPFVWFWPNAHTACMMMTHDVEEAAGRDFCSTLMKLDEGAGLRSSFQIIPEERYHVPPGFLEDIRSRGHEVNVHDLNHDGHLFREREEFLRRTVRIRKYARDFRAVGFRSGALYRNLDWFDSFTFDYDMSVPNVAHLDPQRGGCCTVMPYFIGRVLELPLTTTQDYSLFHILREYSLNLWNEQIAAILPRHGLISFNIHPDYITERRALALYMELLSRLAYVRAKHNVWAALPREVNVWWRQRSEMELVRDGSSWRIVGEGCERARVAYAALDGDRLVYSLSP